MTEPTHQIRILLIEDEASLAAAVKKGLTGENFVVEVVADGAEGLAMARLGTWDVIILDIMLPTLNGFKVCRALREEGNWTPILMLTAKNGEWDEAEALDTGADSFLSKPFSFPVLVARLRALARRDAAKGSHRLEVGDLILDPEQRECSRGTTRIALTNREFSLLEVLMRRPGAVVAKDDLLTTVWGGDFKGDPNVVEVYIGYLRRKIDRPFNRHTLKTVRGAGYMVSADD